MYLYSPSLFYNPKEDDINLEANENYSYAKFDKDELLSISDVEWQHFYDDLMKAKSLELLKICDAKSMYFYSWVDYQASKLCWSLVSVTYNKLPFSTQYKIIESPIEFLTTLRNIPTFISFTKLRECDNAEDQNNALDIIRVFRQQIFSMYTQ